jgi:hypothetical protein
MKGYIVDRERWSKMHIFDQLGNIYSEVGRSFAAKKRHNETDAQLAMERAIDLFDATVAILIRERSPKSSEVLRAKEEYLRTLLSPNPGSAEIQSLDRYFMQFALAARLQR